MYGMVNQAIEQMVRADYGATVWAAIRRRAGVTQEVFVTTELYPDEITASLLVAASDCTGVSGADLRHRLGEFWMFGATAENGLFAVTGSDVGQFLSHLSRLRDRMSLLFPELNLPRLAVEDRTAGAVRIRCSKLEPAMIPFATGLLSGIGRRFNTPVVVTVDPAGGETGGPARIRVEW